MTRPPGLAALLFAACTRASAPPVTAPPAAPSPGETAPADAAVLVDAAAPADAPAAPADTPAAPAEAPAACRPGACCSGLAMPAPQAPARENAFAPRPAASPAVARTCAAMAEATRRRLAAVLQEYREDYGRSRMLDPLLTCADAGDGAWTFSVTVGRPRPSSLEGEFVHPVTLRVVYVTAAGAARPAARTVSLVLGAAHFAHFASVADVGVFDWDGDGRAELFFREAHEQEENNTEAARSTRWWTFTAGAAAAPREFAREASPAASIDDYDRDGRPDLLLRSPWVVVGPCGLSDVDNVGPRPLLHATRDGRFVEDDVSHAWLASQCPARPTELFDGLGGGDLYDINRPQFRVACARLYGASASDVAARVERSYPPGADDSPAYCYPRAELVRAAHVDPPGAFRLGCDAPR